MSIRVKCGGCSRAFNAPDAAAGKRAKCPGCGGPIVVPMPEPVSIDAELDGFPSFDDEDFDVKPAASATTVDADSKPCPKCGEMIARGVSQCRNCGKMFAASAAKKGKKRKAASYDEDSDLSTGDWVLVVVCSGLGCIMGLVYLVQGKSKAAKVIGLSLLFGFVWNSVFAAIRSMNVNQ